MHHQLKAFSPEERYRLLVDAVTDYAIYMVDTDGIVVSWNSGAHRLTGYPEHEIVGRHFSRLYVPADVVDGAPSRTLYIAATEGRFKAEAWRMRKNGERFWARVVVDPIRAGDGTLLGFAKVTRDLTERRAAEQALRDSEEQFGLLVQSVTDYAIYMLTTEGKVRTWNAGAQRIKGYEPHEVIGSHFSRFYRDEDRAADRPAAALRIAAREGRFESEGWRVRKDGSQFWASVVIDPILNAQGELRGFAKVTRDVTEKREAQVALERAREALFQSQKLDAIGQLTGGVAHDFNNLLMVVLSSLELLKRRVKADEKSQRLIDNAVQGARRGVTLTKRMLAFARQQQLAPVAVHVESLVSGMRDLLERSLGPTIRVELDFQPGLRPVFVDPNQLELAVLNLAVNARDAMPRGGTLGMSTRPYQAFDNSTKPAAGEYVCLSVTDTGSGMSAATLARATEPFFTTKGVGKGTGLGLPMVHGLAAQSGGHFALHSGEGTGTTAELWLPVAQAGIEVGTIDAAAPPAAGSEHSLIVVAVDDDALVLAGTVAMLEDLGHVVLPASSARQALDLIEAEPNVAMVITDQVMPNMTGGELIARLCAAHPRIPVILATGFGELPDGVDATALRLAKPFDQDELADAIRNVFAGSATRRAVERHGHEGSTSSTRRTAAKPA
jgi:PAS domain S-box-containing protein